jgi:hypothetical protein
MNDFGHDVAGGEHHMARFDLVTILQLHANGVRSGIEYECFGFEQTCATGDGDFKQAVRQLHRIGICGPRRNDRARAGNAEIVEQRRVIEKCARQVRTLPKLVFFDGDTVACIPYEAKRNTGILLAGPGLRGVYHRARIRATRWLHPGYGAFSSTAGDL